MSAMLETDWMPYTFTMNWQITRKRKWIRFEKGEPIAQFFPVPRRIVDDCEPEMVPLATDADLNATVDGWQKMRKDFIEKLNDRDPETETGRLAKTLFPRPEPRWQPRKS
jgi:antitoxin (DNA-binding transcriptional repressor) of toxin-antitoxin stability system